MPIMVCSVAIEKTVGGAGIEAGEDKDDAK